MFDFAQFEAEVQAAADERILDVIESMIDHMLDAKHNLTPLACSYKQYHHSYVRTKLIIHRLKQHEFYYDDLCKTNGVDISATKQEQYDTIVALHPKIKTFHRGIDRLEYKLEELHTKMYVNPCKTCTTCQSRRKRWPTLPTLTS